MFARPVTSVNTTGASDWRRGAGPQPSRNTRLRAMIVDRLSFIVILGAQLSGESRNFLGGFIRLKAPEQRLLIGGLPGLSKSPVAEHQIVMSLDVFRIHGQHLLQSFHGLRILAFEK